MVAKAVNGPGPFERAHSGRNDGNAAEALISKLFGDGLFDKLPQMPKLPIGKTDANEPPAGNPPQKGGFFGIDKTNLPTVENTSDGSTKKYLLVGNNEKVTVAYGVEIGGTKSTSLAEVLHMKYPDLNEEMLGKTVKQVLKYNEDMGNKLPGDGKSLKVGEIVYLTSIPHFDANGRLQLIKRPDGSEFSFKYSQKGELLSCAIKDTDGKRTEFTKNSSAAGWEMKDSKGTTKLESVKVDPDGNIVYKRFDSQIVRVETSCEVVNTCFEGNDPTRSTVKLDGQALSVYKHSKKDSKGNVQHTVDFMGGKETQSPSKAPDFWDNLKQELEPEPEPEPKIDLKPESRAESTLSRDSGDNKLHPKIERAINNLRDYPIYVRRNAHVVAEVGQELGLRTEVIVAAIATMMQESLGNHKAVGDNGASKGLFQLNRYGKGANLPDSVKFSPEANARIALAEWAKVQHLYNNNYYELATLARNTQRPSHVPYVREVSQWIRVLNA